MDEHKTLYFELLGPFLYGDNRGGKDTEREKKKLKAGRKMQSFLQYLIVHHEHGVSAEELIGEFWPESGDPASALRRMLYETRTLLNTMFPTYEDLLETCPGSYTWNQNISFELDTERFEKACLHAVKKQEKERLALLLSAIKLYRGDFLPSNDSNWAIGLRQYYRALYLDACKTVLPLLIEKEQWIETLGVCEQAYRIDFAVEDFTLCAMRALIALGQPEQAIGKYEAFRERMQKELGLPPTDSLEQMRLLAEGLRKKDMGVPDVFNLLCEEDIEERAFFCTFEMFRGIVALERRHLVRSKGHSSIAIVRLGYGSVPATDARRLERILLDGLRGGDPVARLEAGSYIIMLTGAGAEDAQAVLGRLDRLFHKTYWRSKARLSYHVTELTN